MKGHMESGVWVCDEFEQNAGLVGLESRCFTCQQLKRFHKEAEGKREA